MIRLCLVYLNSMTVSKVKTKNNLSDCPNFLRTTKSPHLVRGRVLCRSIYIISLWLGPSFYLQGFKYVFAVQQMVIQNMGEEFVIYL